MATPLVSTGFADLLDPRFQRIFSDQYNQLPDMLPELFAFPEGNGRNNMTWSSVGALGDWTQFQGNVEYDNVTQGYDTTCTPVEFVSGIQVERKLYDDDQFNIIDGRPKALAIALNRTRQKHGARILNNAFSVDGYFYNNTEAVALCSDSHTTTSQIASTATGFDNKITSALSAVAVAAARIQFMYFRDDRGNRINPQPNELWYPTDLYEIAQEIVGSAGKLDTANNNTNVQQGAWKTYEWNYLSDTNNWFMADGEYRKQSLFWVDRVSKEFAMVEDFDTLVAKWRGYARYANAWIDWRWIIGASVS